MSFTEIQQRRKEIYELKYPESKQYSSEKQKQKKEIIDKISKPDDKMTPSFDKMSSFTKDMAKKTGKSQRTIINPERNLYYYQKSL